MQTAKKILATLLPTGMLLIGSAGIAAADSYSNSTPNGNSDQMSQNMTNWNGGSMYQNDNSGDSSDTSDQTFAAETFGHEEVPPVPDMTTGHISVKENSNSSLSYTYTLSSGKKITMAHLHCAPPGENGPSVVTLYMSMGADINGTLASGQISDSDILPSAKGCSDTVGYEISNVQDLMQALENGDIYANAHSMDYPDGVSRGQLSQNDSNGNSQDGNGNSWSDSNSSRNSTWSDDQDSDNSDWSDSSSSNWNDDSDSNNDNSYSSNSDDDSSSDDNSY